MGPAELRADGQQSEEDSAQGAAKHALQVLRVESEPFLRRFSRTEKYDDQYRSQVQHDVGENTPKVTPSLCIAQVRQEHLQWRVDHQNNNRARDQAQDDSR